MRFDLQSHSTYSDGSLSPAGVVAAAAAQGVELLALTDHDTVSGVAEALSAARVHGIRVTPAAELSSVDGRHEDLHILGYGIDHEDPELAALLDDFRGDRQRRVLAMADKLRELGLEFSADELDARVGSGRPLGRPHLADAVLAHPANAARLAQEGAADRSGFFERYLVPGALAWVGRTRPTVAGAIDVIKDAGGVAVWAHPFWDVASPDEVLETAERFRAYGLDGIEVFYKTHTREQTELLHSYCARSGLLATGSADFHGPGHEAFNVFLDFETHGLAPVLGPIGEL